MGIDHCQFEFRPYDRPFRQPLQTSRGLWTVRKGIILKLSDELGRVGFGEIAPLEWFGSESVEDAIEFCHQLPLELDRDIISAIPDYLPACQFGFETAWERVATDKLSVRNTNQSSVANLSYSALLPTGEAACQAWEKLWNQGYRTFKWKIGVALIDTELSTFQQLVGALPSEAKLRLDANGGLTEAQTRQWLQACDDADIELLEQPLMQFDTLLQLSEQYSTPIALDESVATIAQLQSCYDKGWRGIFVIKPAIAGSPFRLRQFCQEKKIDTVFSSVFETAIGRQAGLALAAELSYTNRAVGYGTTHWFQELVTEDFEELWQSL